MTPEEIEAALHALDDAFDEATDGDDVDDSLTVTLPVPADQQSGADILNDLGSGFGF